MPQAADLLAQSFLGVLVDQFSQRRGILNTHVKRISDANVFPFGCGLKVANGTNGSASRDLHYK